MDDAIFSSQSESLEEVVLLMLEMRHLTLSVAESCTGGLLSERLTAVPNSSRAFVGGAVVYTPETKMLFADVPREMIDHSWSRQSRSCPSSRRGNTRTNRNFAWNLHHRPRRSWRRASGPGC